MRIAILGAGHIGGVLARLWSAHDHSIVFGLRDPQAESSKGLKSTHPGASVAGFAEAVKAAEVIALAVPFEAAQQVLSTAGSLDGRVVIDCTNPVKPDLSGLVLGTTTSAAEEVALWSKGRVVKAFNTIGAGLFGQGTFAGERADGYFCGDDTDAKSTVRTLVEQAGFNPIDVGALRVARYLEPLAVLWMELAVRQGRGSTFSFKVVQLDRGKQA